MRVGVLGAGRMGAVHATTLAADPRVDDLIVADVDAAAADAVARQAGAPSRAAGVDALFAARPAAVVVAAPTSAHEQLVGRACDAGIPALCEKPLAADVAATRRTARRAAAGQVPVWVGFQRRFDAGYAAARAALAAGRLGALRRVHALTCDASPPPAEFVAGSGGLFRDCSIHDFDAIRFVTGVEVVEVFALGASRGAGYFAANDDVDEAACVLTLADGTLATVQASRYNGAGYDVRLEVAGTAGTIAVGLDDRAALASAEPGVTFPAGPAHDGFAGRFGPAYAAELAAFLDLAAGPDRPGAAAGAAAGPDDALAALLVADAADRSRREHRPVQVEPVAG